jgi:hypothetical protein
MTETRKRDNAKQNAKGFWQLDITVEMNGVLLPSDHPNLLGEIIHQEKLFRADGRKMAGDE